MDNLVPLGCDVLVRGERAVLRHVEPVPATRDLFGHRRLPHYRCVVVWADGRWANDVNLHELQPIDA